MIYLYSFLFSGIVCLISSILYFKTKLTQGHITILLVLIGVILGGLGIYPKLCEIFGGGAKVLIINFGSLLTLGAIENIHQSYLNIFEGMFKYTSFTLSYVLVISLIMSLFFRNKGK